MMDIESQGIMSLHKISGVNSIFPVTGVEVKKNLISWLNGKWVILAHLKLEK